MACVSLAFPSLTVLNVAVDRGCCSMVVHASADRHERVRRRTCLEGTEESEAAEDKRDDALGAGGGRTCETHAGQCAGDPTPEWRARNVARVTLPVGVSIAQKAQPFVARPSRTAQPAADGVA